MGATLILNMKFLVLFACVAAASAVQLVTYPNGAVAPAKTPEVVAAEAAHFAAQGVAPVAYAGYPYYNGYYPGGLVAYANGAVAPAKTPEVVAAEIAHFAAQGIAAPVAGGFAIIFFLRILRSMVILRPNPKNILAIFFTIFLVFEHVLPYPDFGMTY